MTKSLKSEPELSEEVIKEIEEAKKRIEAGEYSTLEEAEKILGFDKDEI